MRTYDKNGNWWDSGITYAQLSRLRDEARRAVRKAQRKVEKRERWLPS